MIEVAVIDHGAGNLVSMMRAIETVGASPTLVTEGSLESFDRVVLPGVGATGPAMRTLNSTGLSDALRTYRGPLLGVCVGMQLLFEYSYEDDTGCLGLLEGVVDGIDATPLPHIGWNSVASDDDDGNDPLYYFVHSYVARPRSPSVIGGYTRYGKDRFASVVRRGDISGVQFHPERSGNAGLALLSDFIADVRRVDNVA
ncbi:MAG: imidazole glycerol phosphate synthase subunit HisH [Actinomycetota bacterium]